MTTLPTATALAVLVVLAGIAGVVAADPTDALPTAAGAAVVTTSDTDETADADGAFERRLAERLSPFNLTDAQVRTIVSEASRLRDDGASRLVIRSSVVMHLYEYGVDAPFLYAGDHPTVGERIAERLGERFDLSRDQVAEIAATVDRLHEAGASRAEIYRAVRALLVEYGVDEDEIDDLRRRQAHSEAHRLHERSHALHERADRLHHAAAHDGAFTRSGDAVDRHVVRLQDRHGLTDGQAATLERLIRGMLDDGADRDAVAAAVREQLAEWGADGGPGDGERRRTAATGRATA